MKYIDTYINIANDNIIIVSKTKSCKFVFSIFLLNLLKNFFLANLIKIVLER